ARPAGAPRPVGRADPRRPTGARHGTRQEEPGGAGAVCTAERARLDGPGRRVDPTGAGTRDPAGPREHCRPRALSELSRRSSRYRRVQSVAWNWPALVTLAPTISPAGLIPSTWLNSPPSVPRSVMTPFVHTTAWRSSAAVIAEPTICPAGLMAIASLQHPPGSVPRSVMTPFSQKKA